MKRNWIGFSAILIGMSTSALMQTLVATSLPHIEQEFGGMQLYSWVFAGYMLASTITIPLFGQLADLIGRRIIYVAGLLTFLIGSALISQSNSMEQLVTLRILQGIGAGAVAPAALASIGDLFSPEQRGKIFGIIGAVQVLSNLVGPPLGGWITDNFSWRWGFLLVLPIGIPALILASIGLEDRETSNFKNLHIDWLGALLIGAGLCGGLVGFQWIGDGEQQIYAGILLTLISLLVLGYSFYWEKKQSQPILPISFLQHPIIWRTAIATLLLGLITNSAIAYIPLFLEQMYGRTATEIGVTLLPMLLMAGLASGVGGFLTNRYPRQTSIAAWVLVIIGFIFLTQSKTHEIKLIVAVVGAGLGLLLPIYLHIVQDIAGELHLAAASGLLQLARNLGGAMGIPLLGIWLTKDGSSSMQFNAIFISLIIIGVLGFFLNLFSPGQESTAGIIQYSTNSPATQQEL